MTTLSEDAFVILHAAVTVARERQIKSLATLRSVLAGIYPGKESQVEEAIKYWASYAQAHR